MAAVHPGPALRPHVKAFKSTALAARLAEAFRQTMHDKDMELPDDLDPGDLEALTGETRSTIQALSKL